MNGTSNLSYSRPGESPEHVSRRTGHPAAPGRLPPPDSAGPWPRPVGHRRPGERPPGAPAAGPAGKRTFIGSYPGKIDQVRLVRAALAPVLEGCPLVDDALLISSELAANAAVHSNSAAPGGQFTVRADVYPGDYVWIEVEDQGGAWANRGYDERPHGLDLVHALAEHGNWGVDGDDKGRTVWVRLDWPAG